MIKIGILGAAKIAPKAIIWPAQNRDDCLVVSVASRNLAKAKTFASEHNIDEVHEGYEALIADPKIDLIYNALPPNRHADLSILALKAGKSVLCEKPFAMNARQAKTMIDAAENSKGHLSEAFHYRFHPAALKFLDIIHSGQIGTPQSMTGRFNVSIPNKPGELRYIPELGGGAMMDLGCYTLHLFRLIAKTNPSILSANAIKDTSGVDVKMMAEMDFDGLHGQLTCDMRKDTPREILISVVGSKGQLSFDQYVHPYRGFSVQLETPKGDQSYSHHDTDADYERSTYAYQLDHVVDVINGKTSPLTGGIDALNTMQAMDSVYEYAGFYRG